MADLFDLVAKLTLDSSEYSSGLDFALGKAKSIGGTIAKVGTAAVGAAAAGIVAFGKSAVEAGMTFDSSMSQVAATMGTTVDEISELRDFAQEMGSTTAFSATQAADALNYMALAGYDAETSMQMLPNVLNLAAAGGIELASASDMVTDAQSALGLSLDETSELVDKMAKASSKSNTSVAQLGDAILTVGGTAKNLAGGTTELSTALGILADNGIKGAEGGTALRNIILALSAPTDVAAKKMKSLGLSAYDADGNLRPLEDIFGDLNDVLSDMTQGEQTEVLNTMFNKVDLKSANALLATSKTRWKDLSTEINNASGAAKNMADAQLDNLAGDITLFKSALEGAQIAISDSLSPTLRGFVQDASDGVSRLTEAFKQGGLTAAMEEAGDVLSGLLSRVVDTAPKVVEGALALVKNLGKGLIDNADQIFDAADKIVDLFVGYFSDDNNIKVLADGAVSLLTKFATFIGNNTGKLLPAAAKVITQFATDLTSAENIQKLVSSGGDIIDGVVDGVLGAVGHILDQAPVILDNLAQGIIDNLPSFAGKIAGNLVKILKSVFSFEGSQSLFDWVNIFGMLGTGNIGGAAALLVSKFDFSGKDAGNAFVQSFNETLHGGIGAGGSTTHNGVGGGGGSFDGLATEATGTAEVIAATFSNLNIDISTADAVENLDALKSSINGIIDLQKQLATADEQLEQVADGTADEARLEKKLSRAKETVDAYVTNAGAAAAEMASAITSSQEQVDAFLTNTKTTADGLSAELQGLSDKMTTVTTSFTETAAGLQLAFEDAAKSAVSAWDNVPGEFSRIWGEIASAMNISEAATWGADMVSNFISGINSKLGELRAKVQEMANLVKANVGFSEPSDGPLSDFHTYAPDMMDLFMQGITENEGRLRDTVQNAFDFRDAMTAPEAMTYSATGNGTAETSGKIDAILDAIHEVADALRNQTIEMDGEKVADLIDARIGTNTLMKARV